MKDSEWGITDLEQKRVTILCMCITISMFLCWYTPQFACSPDYLASVTTPSYSLPRIYSSVL
jgi:hypothetical protein